MRTASIFVAAAVVAAALVSGCGELSSGTSGFDGTYADGATDAGTQDEDRADDFCAGCVISVEPKYREVLRHNAVAVIASVAAPVRTDVYAVVGLVSPTPREDRPERERFAHPLDMQGPIPDHDNVKQSNLAVYPTTSYVDADGAMHEINRANPLGVNITFYHGILPYSDSDDYKMLSEEERTEIRTVHVGFWRYNAEKERLESMIGGGNVEINYQASQFQVGVVWWEDENGELKPKIGWR